MNYPITWIKLEVGWALVLNNTVIAVLARRLGSGDVFDDTRRGGWVYRRVPETTWNELQISTYADLEDAQFHMLEEFIESLEKLAKQRYGAYRQPVSILQELGFSVMEHPLSDTVTFTSMKRNLETELLAEDLDFGEDMATPEPEIRRWSAKC